MGEISKYSYQGPIYQYGKIIKLLVDPIYTAATGVDGAYEDFVLRLNKQFGNGTAINKSAIHKVWDKVAPTRFKNVQDVVNHFNATQTEDTTPAPVEAVSEPVESVEEVSVTPKRRKKSTSTEDTTNE